MADIIDLISADQLHIMRWAAKLGQLSRQASTRQRRPELVSRWEADPAFSPLACICQACTDRLDQALAWPALSGHQR